MMKTVRGVYNGTTFVFEDDIRLEKGQEVMVTLLDSPVVRDNKKRNPDDFSVYHTPTERGRNVEEYMREMRGTAY